MVENVIVYGADWCPDCIRAKKFFTEKNINFEYVDLVANPSRRKEAKDVGKSEHIPVVVYPSGQVLVEPTNEELAEASV